MVFSAVLSSGFSAVLSSMRRGVLRRGFLKPGFLASAFLASLGCASALPALSQAIPPATAIPVVLTRSVTAGQAKPGDLVTARTLQRIFLPGGRVLPAGAVLTGHVVASTPFVFDATPYAVQKPSLLAIRFDNVAEGASTLPVDLEVRAIAGPVASHEAEIPHPLDETDWSDTRELIGGDRYSPLESLVLSPAGEVTGYNRREGVFARLLPAESVNPESSVRCEATASEQSVAVFSANACGVYGLPSVFLAANGSGENGAFVLESLRRPVRLCAGSTALLEETTR